MGLPVTAAQDEVSGVPIPELRASYEAIGDGPVVLDLEAYVEWQGKGTRATATSALQPHGGAEGTAGPQVPAPVRRLRRDAGL